jgi:hypothetical protein
MLVCNLSLCNLTSTNRRCFLSFLEKMKLQFCVVQRPLACDIRGMKQILLLGHGDACLPPRPWCASSLFSPENSNNNNTKESLFKRINTSMHQTRKGMAEASTCCSFPRPPPLARRAPPRPHPVHLPHLTLHQSVFFSRVINRLFKQKAISSLSDPNKSVAAVPEPPFPEQWSRTRGRRPVPGVTNEKSSWA